MRKVIILVLLVVGVAGCAVKTPSLIDPARQVTPQQLNLEIQTVKVQLAEKQAAIEEKKVMATASIEKEVAAYNAEVASLNNKVISANADIEEQYAQRDYIFNTVTEVVSAVVPPPYAGFAVLGIGIAGSIFGLVKRQQAATATTAVDVMAKGIKQTNSTAAANAVDNAIKTPEVTALISERVKVTDSNIL